MLLVAAPCAAADTEVRGAGLGYQRVIDLGPRTVEVGIHYGAALPGAAALSGEGSVRTALPFAGQLVMTVPMVVGEAATVGATRLAARYNLATEGELVPGLAVVARVDLPTAPGARVALPGLRATAAKNLKLGPLEGVRLETELSTAGPALAPILRTTLGTNFRIDARTHANLDLVAVRPSVASGVPGEQLAQLGLTRQFDTHTRLQLGVGAGLMGGTRTLRASFSLARHF